MIIFGSISTTFESSSIFGGTLGSIENRLEPKTEPVLGNLAIRDMLCINLFLFVFRFSLLSLIACLLHIAKIIYMSGKKIEQ